MQQMAYQQNPYAMQPYGPQPYAQQQYQQPVHGFVYVTGLDGAKAYQMPPNSEMPLFDSTSENRMFIKTTDGAGFPTIRPARCYFENEQQAMRSEVTADDIAGMKAEIDKLSSISDEVSEMRDERGRLRSIVDAKHVSKTTVK